MPRRNRNSGRPVIDTDRLAATVSDLATTLASALDGKFPCTGCRKRGHWNGGYCPLCRGALILSARARVLSRR